MKYDIGIRKTCAPTSCYTTMFQGLCERTTKDPAAISFVQIKEKIVERHAEQVLDVPVPTKCSKIVSRDIIQQPHPSLVLRCENAELGPSLSCASRVRDGTRGWCASCGVEYVQPGPVVKIVAGAVIYAIPALVGEYVLLQLPPRHLLLLSCTSPRSSKAYATPVFFFFAPATVVTQPRPRNRAALFLCFSSYDIS